MDQIFITKDECETLVDLIECNLFTIIREDTDIDSLEWLLNIMHVYERAKSLLEGKEEQK